MSQLAVNGALHALQILLGFRSTELRKVRDHDPTHDAVIERDR